MKRKTFLFSVIALFLLIVGAGCEKENDEIYTVREFTSKPCVKLPETAEFVQEFNNVQGVIMKHPIVSFGDNHYYIKVPTKMFNSSYYFTPGDWIIIYPACIKFTEKDLGKKIQFSGKLFFTQGYAGNTNMVAFIYVFTDK